MNINLKDPNLLLLHKGVITTELIGLIIESLEQSVTNFEEDRTVRRKLTNVFIESFQNVGFHGEKIPKFTSSDLVIVISRPKYYKIGTSNLIERSKVEVIQNQIDQINDLDSVELRNLQKLALQNNEMSEKGTAGLGFMDIARKSGQKLYYEFEILDDEYAHFYFETRILKDYSEQITKSKRNREELSNQKE